MHGEKKPVWLPWAAVAAVILAFAWLVAALRDILTPFIVAAVIAYILNPLVEKLRRFRIKRGVASMLVTLLALFVLFALMLIIVPMLITQFQNMMARLPQIISYTQDHLIPWINDHFSQYISINRETMTAWLKNHADTLQKGLSTIAPTLVERSSAMAIGLSNIILLPLLLYYFLLDWKRWSRDIQTLIPRRFINGYNRITREMDTVLGEFLRGQLAVMLIMGLIYGTGLALTRLDSGFAIGMIAGLLVFVPYLGAFTGLLLATLAALLQFDSWYSILWVWGVFCLGQFLESFFITPKIVGDRIGLSPFWVIFSLMAFGQLMGFVGMLIGLPLAAVSLVLLREGAALYLGSNFYRYRQTPQDKAKR